MSIEENESMQYIKGLFNANKKKMASLTINEYISTGVLVLSFPSVFSYSRHQDLADFKTFPKKLFDFINKRKSDNISLILYPLIIKGFLEKYQRSGDRNIECFINAVERQIGYNLPEKHILKRKILKTIDSISLGEDIDKLTRLFRCQKVKLSLTKEEFELIKEFINVPENFLFKYYCSKNISIDIILERNKDLDHINNNSNLLDSNRISIINIYVNSNQKCNFATLLGKNMLYIMNNTAIYISDLQNNSSKCLYRHKNIITSISISSSGSLVVSTDIAGSVIIWSYEKMVEISRQFCPILCSCFAPVGGVFAFGCLDGTIHLYDISRLKHFRVLVGHKAPVLGIKFHPNCSLIASSDADNSLRLWDIRTARTARLFIVEEKIQAFDISPSGKLVAIFDRQLNIYNINTQTLVGKCNIWIHKVKGLFFSCDSKCIFIVSVDGDVQSYDISEKKLSYIDRTKHNVINSEYFKNNTLYLFIK